MRLYLLICMVANVFGFSVRISMLHNKNTDRMIGEMTRRIGRQRIDSGSTLRSAFMDDGGGGKEESQMNSYVNKFLGKEELNKKGDTYLLAIPCDDLHELQIELESVQRAIVYNCPVAVHACIPTSGTRIPLMTVTGDVSVGQLQNIVSNSVQTSYKDMPAFQFAGLDIESGKISNNEVLHAAIAEGDENSSVTELAGQLSRSILKETTCQTSVFDRFRVAFMKLPSDWDDLVASQNTTDNDFTPETGGNGISPLHWIEWSEDLFGGPQRMREIGVYREGGRFPVATIPFPGSSIRNENELKWEQYQDDRLKEVENKLMGKSNEDENKSDELMLKLTREKLEKLYESSDTNDTVENNMQVSSNEEDWEDIQGELLEDPQRGADPETIDDWTRQRIRAIVEAKSKARANLTVKRKDLPSIEDNEIFAKYRRGEMDVPDLTPTVGEKDVSDFPNRDHCTGIWKMNTSPTGFAVEEGQDTRSDNIILRVDGTIAGGPILDRETRQKAAGGTWALIFPQEGGGGELRIRLVIPPKKERILVMQGVITRPSDLPLASRTFGIPMVETKAKAAEALEQETIDCFGKVWIEDAMNAKNKDDIGEFSMTKISDLLDPNQYTITIPKNVRSIE